MQRADVTVRAGNREDMAECLASLQENGTERLGARWELNIGFIYRLTRIVDDIMNGLRGILPNNFLTHMNYYCYRRERHLSHADRSRMFGSSSS